MHRNHGTRKEQISSVKRVEIAVVEGAPRRLRITAHAVVSTSGWSQPELIAAGQPAANGIYSFTFVAVRPRGMVLQVLQPISVTQVIDLPDGLRGIRIQAATNAVEATLEST
jgi:hypothetical protein